ncbi:hypothetical protein TAMA11512_16810 [Selenomonas sp. TAMA-11512]|uniref:hypothetical protein n=1 Tax=Selenomonas sp. TAMA-11512 TaxID=3095337 RepID=UPI00308B556B|nr:hypothetical protein TAMA11512_16810 [Selenomonas sp. TAMA-11512]
MEKGKLHVCSFEEAADSRNRQVRSNVFAGVLAVFAAAILAVFTCIPAAQAADKSQYFAPTEHVFFYGQKDITLIRSWSDNMVEILTPEQDKDVLKEIRKMRYPDANRILLDIHGRTEKAEGGYTVIVQDIYRYVFAGDELLAIDRDADFKAAMDAQEEGERLVFFYKRIDGDMGATSIDLSVPKGRKIPKPYRKLVKHVTKELYTDKNDDLTAREEAVLRSIYPHVKMETPASETEGTESTESAESLESAESTESAKSVESAESTESMESTESTESTN